MPEDLSSAGSSFAKPGPAHGPWRWLLLACLLAGGCSNDQASLPPDSHQVDAIAQRSAGDQILRYALDLLNGLDDYSAGGTLTGGQLDLDATARKLVAGGPMTEVVDRLSQWAALMDPPAWEPDPLLAGLPEKLRDQRVVEELGELKFPASDGPLLREVTWLRDISRAVCGDSTDDLERGRLLFDWTVRNIQLESDSQAGAPQPAPPEPPWLPWQTLLLGRGTAVERAWVFILLARQQGLEVVLLAHAEAPGKSLRPWLPALLLDDCLYLFDCRLGLPLPGPGGKGVATLSEAAEDEAVLSQLDLEADGQLYPVKASQADGVIALVEASPVYLSRRMALLESHLGEADRMVLFQPASEVAGRLQRCSHVAEVRLWTLPYERLASQSPQALAYLAERMQPFVLPFLEPKRQGLAEAIPALWKGRVRHLTGRFSGAEGANHFYQMARPADDSIEDYVGSLYRLFVEERMQQAAGDLGLPQQEVARAAMAEANERIDREQVVRLARSAKESASYWLGLVAYERQSYPAAIDYFSKRTLEASPDGPWTPGAWYNLARAYEALGQREDAIRALRDGQSEQRHGNLLRARWLAEAAAGAP